jgi:hypothetical protein
MHGVAGEVGKETMRFWYLGPPNYLLQRMTAFAVRSSAVDKKLKAELA